MRQEELEEKVREIFEQQGFHVEMEENSFTAEKEDSEPGGMIFSSENFGEQEVLNSNASIVFMDEGFEHLKDRIDAEVSIIREEKDEEEYDLPSYELIGDIAVINEINDRDEEEVVEGILNYNPSVKTVLVKEDSLSGEFRVGDYRKLYGEETETVHKEFGCRFKVDPTKVYFSERFSTERNRVISQIESGEKVLVMFAGVGPFGIMAARNAEPERVVMVEKNPVAAEFMKENVELNDVENIVDCFEGDVAEVLPELNQKFDRIIMPLPEKAAEFLDLAVENLAEGGIVHYYRFIEDENWEEIESEVERIFSDREIGFEVIDRTFCGDRGPSVSRVCLDIQNRL